MMLRRKLCFWWKQSRVFSSVMILTQMSKIFALTGLMLLTLALKKMVKSNTCAFTLVGERSGSFSYKRMS